MKGKYDDMLYLPHPLSKKHPRMSNRDRAAQFSPFAALTGFESRIHETARLTDTKIELDDYAREEINHMLCLIQGKKTQPFLITYFRKDDRKAGGMYITQYSAVKKVDADAMELILPDNSRIPFANLYSIQE
ncbi:MAG: hypothetical protein J6A26_05425 [Oscillospiraceae bacterium]|nr:hypothetical protein [Oscillospiraceae bacterium]